MYGVQRGYMIRGHSRQPRRMKKKRVNVDGNPDERRTNADKIANHDDTEVVNDFPPSI